MEAEMKEMLSWLLEISKCVGNLSADDKRDVAKVMVQLVDAMLSSIFSRMMKVEYMLTVDVPAGEPSQTWQLSGSDIGNLDYISTLIDPGDQRGYEKTDFLPLRDVQQTIENLLSTRSADLDKKRDEMQRDIDKHRHMKKPAATQTGVAATPALENITTAVSTSRNDEKDVGLVSISDHDGYVKRTSETLCCDIEKDANSVVSPNEDVPSKDTCSHDNVLPTKRPQANIATDVVPVKKPRLVSLLKKKTSEITVMDCEEKVSLRSKRGVTRLVNMRSKVELSCDKGNVKTRRMETPGVSEAQYSCPVCQMLPFKSQKELHLHIEQWHIIDDDNITKFRCPFCDFVYISVELGVTQLAPLLVEHLKICRKPRRDIVRKKEKNLYCVICNVDWVQKNLVKQIDSRQQQLKNTENGGLHENTNCDKIQNISKDHDDTSVERVGIPEKIPDENNPFISFENPRKLRNHMMMHVTENKFSCTLKCPFCGEARNGVKTAKRLIFYRLEAHIEKVHNINPLTLDEIGTDSESVVENIISPYGERHKLVAEKSKNANYPEVQLKWHCRHCKQTETPLPSEKSLEVHLKSEHVSVKDDMSYITCPECDWFGQIPYRATISARQVAGHYITHAILSHELLSVSQTVINKEEIVINDEIEAQQEKVLSTVTVQTSTGEIVSFKSTGPSYHYSPRDKKTNDKAQYKQHSVSGRNDEEAQGSPSSDQRAASDNSDEVEDLPDAEVRETRDDQARSTSGCNSQHSAEDDDAVTPAGSIVEPVKDTNPQYDCVLCLSSVKFADRATLLRHFVCEHVLEKDEPKFISIDCVFCSHTLVQAEYARTPRNLWCMYLKIMGHMIRNHGCPVPFYVKVYTCWKCGYETIMRIRLAQHMDRMHQIKLDIKKYPQEEQLSVNNEEVDSWWLDSHVKCTSCSQLVRQSLLDNHKLCCPATDDPTMKPSKKQYQCDRCPKIFMSGNGLKRHFLSSHENERNFLCSHCGQKFFAKGDLCAHAWSIHKINMTKKALAECDMCGDSMPKFILNTHRMKHDEEKYMCDVCGQWIVGRARIRDHIRRKHAKRVDANLQCDICGFMASGPKHLRLHQAAKHQKDCFRCQLCKKVYTDPKELSDHMDTVHPGGVRVNFCKICDKQLSSLDAFENHMFVAHKVNISRRKVEKCQECGFETLGKGLMNKHIANHKKSAPVQCEICHKFCSSHINYAEHKRRCHSGRSYRCPHCPFSPKCKSKLVQHVAHVHEKKKYNCQSCGYKTFTETRLKNHQRMAHGISTNEDDEIISDLISQYPEARVESRYVPPISNRNSTSQTSTSTTEPSGQEVSKTGMDSSVYYISHHETPQSLPLNYVVSPDVTAKSAGVGEPSNSTIVRQDGNLVVNMVQQNRNVALDMVQRDGNSVIGFVRRNEIQQETVVRPEDNLAVTIAGEDAHVFSGNGTPQVLSATYVQSPIMIEGPAISGEPIQYVKYRQYPD